MKSSIEKVYHTISEVSEKLGMEKSTIRYYESEFDFISPKRNKHKDRRFVENEIHLLQQVNFLIHDLGMTIEGVRKAWEGEYFNDLACFALGLLEDKKKKIYLTNFHCKKIMLNSDIRYLEDHNITIYDYYPVPNVVTGRMIEFNFRRDPIFIRAIIHDDFEKSQMSGAIIELSNNVKLYVLEVLSWDEIQHPNPERIASIAEEPFKF